jgi:hypothetical protein
MPEPRKNRRAGKNQAANAAKSSGTTPSRTRADFDALDKARQDKVKNDNEQTKKRQRVTTRAYVAKQTGVVKPLSDAPLEPESTSKKQTQNRIVKRATTPKPATGKNSSVTKTQGPVGRPKGKPGR